MQSISSVYFPQFDELIGELDRASTHYVIWTHQAALKRLANNIGEVSDGFKEAYGPYVQKRDALLDALTKFAHEEFQ